MVIELEGMGLIAEVSTAFYYDSMSREIKFSKSLNELPLRGTANLM